MKYCVVMLGMLILLAVLTALTAVWSGDGPCYTKILFTSFLGCLACSGLAIVLAGFEK